MVPKSGTDEIPFYWMIRHPRKNPFCIPFLIINQAIETHQVAFVRVRKAFSSGKMEGSAGAGHSLAPTGCSKPNAPLQSPPGREVQDSAQPNPRAESREGEGRRKLKLERGRSHRQVDSHRVRQLLREREGFEQVVAMTRQYSRRFIFASP